MKQENDLNVNFKEMLSNIRRINQVLDCIEPGQLLLEEILTSYKKNGNRHGVIFMAKNNKTKKKQKIIMDAIYGQPNSTQFKELTYDQGKDCDKRIIFYTFDHPKYKKSGYRHDLAMTHGFAKVNNDCEVETFIIKVTSLQVANDFISCNFYVTEKPDDTRATLIKNLPSKYNFERAVFRVFYNQTDQFGGYENDHMDNIDEWFSGTCWCLDLDGISFMYPVLNEDGLFAQAKSISKEGIATLETIKENYIDNFKKMFVNREVSFEKDLQGDITMSIKLWDKSLSFFTRASLEDKEKIAEFLRKFDHKITEYWDHEYYLKESGDEVVKEHLAIPADAFNELEKDLAPK